MIIIIIAIQIYELLILSVVFILSYLINMYIYQVKKKLNLVYVKIQYSLLKTMFSINVQNLSAL